MIISSDVSPGQENHSKYNLLSQMFLWCSFRTILM